jgi:hypothetical protein
VGRCAVAAPWRLPPGACRLPRRMRGRRQLGGRYVASVRGRVQPRRQETHRYFRANGGGALNSSAVSLASGAKRGGQVVSGQWRPGCARGGEWANQPTRSQTARHRAPGRERVADSGMGRDESFTYGRHGGGRRRARSGGQ